jgi:hypothetical protein
MRVVESKQLLSLSVSLMLYCSEGAKEVEVQQLVVGEGIIASTRSPCFTPYMFYTFPPPPLTPHASTHHFLICGRLFSA